MSSRSVQQYGTSPAWRKVLLIQMCLSILTALPTFSAPGWILMETPARGAELNQEGPAELAIGRPTFEAGHAAPPQAVVGIQEEFCWSSCC